MKNASIKSAQIKTKLWIFINCSIINNGGRFAAAVYGNQSSPRLINCLISGNVALHVSIYHINSGSPIFINCTIAGNTFVRGGGTLIAQDRGTIQLTNCVIYNNGTDPTETFDGLSGGVIRVDYSLLPSEAVNYSSGTGNLTATSSPFVSGTNFQLRAGAQAIDAGDPSSTTATSGATDLGNNPRIANNRIDIGAYEYQGPFCQPVTITSQPPSGSSVCTGSTVTATVSVSGTSPIYQWYKDGTSLTSQRSATLTLTNLTTDAMGNYAVVITGACSSLTSTAFSLTLNQASPPSLMASATTTTNQPISVTALGCAGGSINWQLAGGAGSANGRIYTLSTPGSYTLSASCAVGACSSLPLRLILTIQAAGALQLTPPDYNCATGRLTYHTRGGDGSLIEFFAIGVTPWSAEPTHTVSAGVRNDPKKILLQARQKGQLVSYLFDLPAYCAGLPTPPQSSTNPAPLVGKGISNQTANQNQAYSFSIPLDAFSDPRGEPLIYYALNLPPGLSLMGRLISGLPTEAGRGVVTLIAVDPSGQTASNGFSLAVDPPNPPPTDGSPFKLLAPAYNCYTGWLTFRTSGGDGSRVEYSAAGVTDWTSKANQTVSAGLRGDPKVILLKARQGGREVSLSFDLKANCGGSVSARQGVEDLAGPVLGIRVLGNPVQGQSVEVEIEGALDQWIEVQLLDLQGRLLHTHHIDQGGSLERLSVPLGRNVGILVLQVRTATQAQQVKLLRP